MNLIYQQSKTSKIKTLSFNQLDQEHINLSN